MVTSTSERIHVIYVRTPNSPGNLGRSAFEIVYHERIEKEVQIGIKVASPANSRTQKATPIIISEWLSQL